MRITREKLFFGIYRLFSTFQNYESILKLKIQF